ncbi:HK97 gp10 family phage protein [Cytobacillus oceanisediminis]|uniref:HK97-gp10 family putative phage morphogenesis protein n=1 Tax=Cytobacillus oceanisediminis TaxID=665099 RepID=UPI001CCADB55|nr:HK97-gp10 family putative phage morphogenesis protein [Cytobacillus oceanisediminis]MBZ9535942.1 HK97 gp10 family phage protein [Cytobacillus oceanisediminis]
MGFKLDFHELEERLIEMEKKASKEIVEKVLTKGGKEIAEGIRANIQEEDLILTGKLKESIGVHSLSGKGTKSKIKVGIKKGTSQEIFRYGMTHNFGSAKGVYPAYHFMEKGYQEKKKKAQEKIVETLKEELGL